MLVSQNIHVGDSSWVKTPLCAIIWPDGKAPKLFSACILMTSGLNTVPSGLLNEKVGLWNKYTFCYYYTVSIRSAAAVLGMSSWASLMAQQDKGICCQAWEPEFVP